MSAYPIPDEAFDRHAAIIGRTGSGKSHGAKTFVERLLDRSARVAIIDPTGSWSGLRLSADGKTPAYPVLIAGGDFGDLPLTDKAGPVFGELVAEGNVPFIADLSQMYETEQRRFVAAFLQTLFAKNRRPLYLVIDEADAFAPQSAMKEEKHVAHEVARVVKRGRKMGFRCILITQRPATIAKNVLNQVNAMVAMQLTGPTDRAAFHDWASALDPEKGSTIEAALPKLPRGCGFLWLPQAGVLEPILFPKAKTYDSGREPEEGHEPDVARFAKVDLPALRGRIEEYEQQAAANDPAKLKAQVRQLTAELAKSKQSAPVAEVDETLIDTAHAEGYQKGFADGARAGRRQALDLLDDALSPLAPTLSDLRSEKLGLPSVGYDGITPPPRAAGHAGKPTFTPSVKLAARAPAKSDEIRRDLTKSARPASPGDATLTGPQRKLLQALAWWKAMGHTRPSRPQIAGIAGWKITSGHLKNVIGSLNTAGLVAYPTAGSVELTVTGIAAAPDPDLSVNLHDGIRSALSGPQRQIFDTLLRSGRAMQREAIAESLGWAPTSGHLKNVIGSLRALEIVEYPTAGEVKLQAWVTE